MITAVLTLGIIYVRRKRIIPHGYAILAAVFLNALSVLVVMLPSVYRILSGASINPFTVVVIVHSILGAASVLAGVYLMAIWRLRKPGESCFRIVRYMKPLAIAWMISAALGAFVYYMLL
jgi:uncharacterized membrane protein YozB (DUF420 family)